MTPAELHDHLADHLLFYDNLAPEIEHLLRRHGYARVEPQENYSLELPIVDDERMLDEAMQ